MVGVVSLQLVYVAQRSCSLKLCAIFSIAARWSHVLQHKRLW